ncbi:efflux transporter outer membrane subunit, partial [Ideonella sp.]|uniref:efflux transporter outer membrane subunit n=1 Tax=Ideonella sp. TaxID=1929293 RepID=UPI003BB50124
DLRLAVLRVDEARAAYGIQRAEQQPGLGASVDGARARIPADLNLTGQPLVGNQFQVGLGLASWELDFWGRVRSLKGAALETYLASDEARRAVTLALIHQVAQSYLALRETDERLALARRAEASRQESLRIFRRRVELGATSKLELTLVELLWQQAHALVTQLELTREQQAHALTLLVGRPVALQPASTPLSAAWIVAPLPPGLPSALLVQRPDILAAEHGLLAGDAQIGAARAAFFPRIALTGAFGTASAELDGLFQPGSTAWNWAPSISLPLLDGGRRAAALELARVRREQALVRYEQTVRSAFRDVSDALAARRNLAEQVQTVNATLAVQTERARLAKLRYDSGAARYLEVLDAERDLLALAQQAVQVRRAQLSAEVSLYAAIGGGSLSFPFAGAPEPVPGQPIVSNVSTAGSTP